MTPTIDELKDGYNKIVLEKSDTIYDSWQKNRTASKKLVAQAKEYAYDARIKKDGTFSWNSTSNVGHEYGVSRLVTYGYYTRTVELWKIRNDGTDHTEFFVLDQLVSFEEFSEFQALLSDESVEFYDLTEENIEKYITVEAFALK